MITEAKKTGLQWDKTVDRLFDKTTASIQDNFWNELLPPCHLRSNCHWYHQNGVFACKVCIYVENGKNEMEPQTEGQL